MPPKPQGDRAMTGAERVRKHRERLRAANPALTDRQKLLAALKRIRELEGAPAAKPTSKPAPLQDDLVKARDEEIVALRQQLAARAKPATHAPQGHQAEPAMTLDMISTKTGREQAEIFTRQYEKKMKQKEAEIREQLRVEYARYFADLTAEYREKEKHLDLISARHKGFMKKPLFNKFRMAVHPDSYRNLSTEDRNELSHEWEKLKPVMLKAEDAPTGPSSLPKTREEWDRRKAEYDAQRAAARAAKKQGRK